MQEDVPGDDEGRVGDADQPGSGPPAKRGWTGWVAYNPPIGMMQAHQVEEPELRARPLGTPATVTLMPEYSVGVPLWPLGDSTDALVPEGLLVKLMSWQADFVANFRWETGWRSQAAKERWAAAAVPLEAELREALAGKAEVKVDLWPLNSD